LEIALQFQDGEVLMCRNIRQLRGSTRPSEDEITLAALQYVRKVSGYRVPSRANTEVFEAAVTEIADSTRRLLDGLSGGSAALDGQPRLKG
jgi:hypothetical protein